MSEVPTSDESKELYAHFGLSLYCANVLEHAIVNLLLFLDLLDDMSIYSSQKEYQDIFDTYSENAFQSTLGQLKNRLRNHESSSRSVSEVLLALDECVGERNFLVHHFWRTYAAWWYIETGRSLMKQRLECARDLFSETTEKLDKILAPIAERYGVTEETARREMTKIKKEIGVGTTEFL